MDELAIVKRIFVKACEKFGSAAHFAAYLGISLTELKPYLEGQVMPSETLLLCAVELILDDLPSIKREVSRSAWRKLFPDEQRF